MTAGTQGLGANTLGVYYTPIVEDLGILHGDFAMNVTISAFATGLFSLLVPYLLARISYKKIVCTGILLSFIGITGMGFTHSIFLFNLLGMARGVGISFTAMVSGAALINQWFEEKNGLAISLATSFSGLAGVLFSLIFSRLIANIGWEKTFLFHGVFTVILCLPILWLPFKFSPYEEGLFPYDAKFKKEKNERTEGAEVSFKYQDVLNIAVLSLIGMAFLQTAIVGLNQHLPSYGYTRGMNLERSGIMLSGAMLGNVSFKLITGFLYDRLGSVKAMVVVMVLNIISLLGLLYFRNGCFICGSAQDIFWSKNG